MSRILIRGGRVIDPAQYMDRVTNILIDAGKVAGFDVPSDGLETIIDASGKIVVPGLIDMHVELREPGREEDETIETGTAAAVAGGFTSIVCLPNTEPPIDTRGGVEFIRHQAARADNANVLVIACVSKNREGAELAEIGALDAAGAVGFSDAPSPVLNPELMRRALEYCRMFDRPVLNHPEATDLTCDGIMHEGVISTILGLPGMPADAEDVMATRDTRLAEATGGRLHLMNISSAGAVEQIRRVKARGIAVTAHACPQHFTLTDESLRSFDTRFKVNPPLRSAGDVAACIAGLADGTIDVIASGHSPRAPEKKMSELDIAPFGLSGLETALGLVITRLIAPGHLDWSEAVRKMSTNPAAILGLTDKGSLEVGADGDVTIIDPDVRWTVNPDAFLSKSKSTPFAGMELQGRAHSVIVGGKVKR